jgi:hypothetical protein
MVALVDLADVCNRFKEINLHDSRLMGLTVERRPHESISDVRLTLSLPDGRPPNVHWTSTRLVFLDCTYSRIEIDHAMTRVAGDAISGSICSRDSDLRRELESGLMKHEKSPLSEYLEFIIGLCPPGGELHFFARDFRIETASTASG